MNQSIDDAIVKFGIPLNALEKIIDTIKLDKRVKEIILFGSRAKGNFKKGSDVDIAIVADLLSFDELNQIRVNIDKLIIPYNVDVIDFNKITNNELKEHILRVGQIVQ
ncbi:MAG: nucleotidyltransferase domain-containing protein [Melioribacteraceae bacterium]